MLATDASSGNVQASVLYDPYGNARYISGTMPGSYGFTGQRADATTGLDYYKARYYDPAAGQFTSADPIPDGLNRYGYVAGNPETYVDPTGEDLSPLQKWLLEACLFFGLCPNPQPRVKLESQAPRTPQTAQVQPYDSSESAGVEYAPTQGDVVLVDLSNGIMGGASNNMTNNVTGGWTPDPKNPLDNLPKDGSEDGGTSGSPPSGSGGGNGGSGSGSGGSRTARNAPSSGGDGKKKSGSRNPNIAKFEAVYNAGPAGSVYPQPSPVEGFWNGVQQILSNIGQGIQDAWGSVTGWLGAAWSNVTTAAGEFWNNFSNPATTQPCTCFDPSGGGNDDGAGSGDPFDDGFPVDP